MKQRTILQVEDNEGDVFLISEAFKEANSDVNIIVARNGREAIEYLNNCASIPTFVLPDLILLDINLPKLNGHQVLNYCKSSEFKEIPIIILSTSSAQEDILKCYKNYANCYITKPNDVVDYMDTIKAIDAYWLNFSQLPHNQLN
jgi:CheY-like chemotaxis protein